jgi:hypothetical protein
MSEEIDLNAIVGFVYSIQTEDELQVIQRAINARFKLIRENKAQKNLATLMPDTAVRFTNLKPAYLNLAKGTIVSVKDNGSFLVKIDDGPESFRARKRYGAQVGVPASCIIPL